MRSAVVQEARVMLAHCVLVQELRKVVRSDAVWNINITTSIGAESMRGDLVGMVL
jgi:hypothetical protein